MSSCWLRETALYESAGVLVPLSKMVGLRDCEGVTDPPEGASCQKHQALFDAEKIRLASIIEVGN